MTKRADPSEAVLSTGCTIRQALRWGIGALTAAGVDSPRLDAELLLGHVLGLTRTQLHVHAQEEIDRSAAEAYTQLVRRRMSREPLAYIVGRRAFFDLELIVSSDVLVPRPETELLVEETLRWAELWQARGKLHIVDVGTGSGAIAIAIARHLPEALVWAVDISFPALMITQENARRTGVQGRVLPIQGDLLAPFKGPFQVIVANLPYVPHHELPELMPEISLYEPSSALDGGTEGLEIIRRLLPQAARCLSMPGLLLLEIDPRQSQEVCAMIRQSLPRAQLTVLRDYGGLDRVVRAEHSLIPDEESNP
ncbi:MAG: peptide chain release factor N(5)-glutamine methyltransferase [Chloroflexi bacterium]|nr:peptide chain release factor N(5)-glutamine methyltransferase [Chloroflexota bacterium]